MRKLSLLLLLLAGCVAPSIPVSTGPPMPPASKPQVRLTSPKDTRPVLRSGVMPATVPTWTFEVNGNYRVEASTNLFNWWPVAVVYSVTNITLSSDTVDKYPALFYRVQPEK